LLGRSVPVPGVARWLTRASARSFVAFKRRGAALTRRISRTYNRRGLSWKGSGDQPRW
jgi:hypothetical protein